MENTQISVIIPIYNAELYLPKCINSVLAQNYIHFELILVNDGSTDKSGEICDEYALSDIRISVIHQKNAGVSKARNAGLKFVKNEYVCFIDSDDWVDELYLSNFMKCMSSMHYDIILQGMIIEYGETQYKRVLNSEDYNKAHLSNCFVDNNLITYGGPCCKLFYMPIIKKNNISFPENISFGEDTLFFMDYFSHMQTACSTSETAYHYRCTEEETLSKKHHLPENLLYFYDKYYTNVYDLIIKNERKNDFEAIFYSLQIRGLSTSTMNLFRLNYSHNQRYLFYKSMRSLYRMRWRDFRGLSLFESGIKCNLSIMPLFLMDILWKLLFAFRNSFPDFINPFHKKV